MNPANQEQARQQVRALLTTPKVFKRQRFQTAATRKRSLARAEAIAEVLWRRWYVGPFRWKVKHLRWYLEVHLSECSDATRYQHWLTIRRVCAGMERDHLLAHLSGRWQQP